MFVFLPKGTKISALVQEVTPKNWQQWLDSFENAAGQPDVPKFRVEFVIELNAVLSLWFGRKESMGSKYCLYRDP
jgi:serine protease inhibitor